MIGMIALLGSIAGPQPAQAEYHVSVDTGLRFVEVAATLPRATTRLFMDSVQADHLPKGWATHVRDLIVRVDGRRVPHAAAAGAAWTLAPRPPGPLSISYRIDLAFARNQWPSGNEQAAAVFDSALYLVGRSLFIVGDAEAASRVTFAVPHGWRISAPWAQRTTEGREFSVANATELTRNALVIGAHPSVRLRAGQFDLQLALPGQTPASAELVEPVLRRVLGAYLELFPGTPPTKYLMTYFQAGTDDGESFSSSATFTTTDPVTPDGTIVWGNFLAHELMHFWNGQRIRGAGPRTEWRWLAEGFTEYYANVTLARQGLISEELFLKKAERHIGNYLYFATAPSLDRMSLAQAGRNTSRNRFGVYDGGWTVALCLDGLIRENSGDANSLDTFMRALWERRAHQSRYSVTELDSLVRTLAGSNLGNVVQRFVEETAVLPVAECLERFGLAAATKGYAAEAFIFSARDSGARARARWRALIGRSLTEEPLTDSVFRRLDSLWARMYAEHDTATALQLYSERLVFTSATGAHKTRVQELADIRPTPGLTMHYFRTTPAQVVASANAASVSGVAEWQFTWNGRQRTVRRGYMMDYERGGPLGWQIVSVTMSAAP